MLGGARIGAGDADDDQTLQRPVVLWCAAGGGTDASHRRRRGRGRMRELGGWRVRVHKHDYSMRWPRELRCPARELLELARYINELRFQIDSLAHYLAEPRKLMSYEF